MLVLAAVNQHTIASETATTTHVSVLKKITMLWRESYMTVHYIPKLFIVVEIMKLEVCQELLLQSKPMTHYKASHTFPGISAANPGMRLSLI